MTSRRSQVTSIPDWLLKLPGDARLRRSELASVLGYKTVDCLAESIKNGHWPDLKAIEHKELRESVTTEHSFVRALYKVSDVRNLLRKLIKENKEH